METNYARPSSSNAKNVLCGTKKRTQKAAETTKGTSENKRDKVSRDKLYGDEEG